MTRTSFSSWVFFKSLQSYHLTTTGPYDILLDPNLYSSVAAAHSAKTASRTSVWNVFWANTMFLFEKEPPSLISAPPRRNGPSLGPQRHAIKDSGAPSLERTSSELLSPPLRHHRFRSQNLRRNRRGGILEVMTTVAGINPKDLSSNPALFVFSDRLQVCQAHRIEIDCLFEPRAVKFASDLFNGTETTNADMAVVYILFATPRRRHRISSSSTSLPSPSLLRPPDRPHQAHTPPRSRRSFALLQQPSRHTRVNVRARRIFRKFELSPLSMVPLRSSSPSTSILNVSVSVSNKTTGKANPATTRVIYRRRLCVFPGSLVVFFTAHDNALESSPYNLRNSLNWLTNSPPLASRSSRAP
ncbi:hypothetical protein B0H19DRAFT_1232610 [Mycena capillaripes]|nr:hypothetical protein B0H19DRAFT_1232610 [Mycena capillaripes]